MNNCVSCGTKLDGRQQDYCSNTCKQRMKYLFAKGQACRACKKPMKPVPVMGGYEPLCDRVRCVKARVK